MVFEEVWFDPLFSKPARGRAILFRLRGNDRLRKGRYLTGSFVATGSRKAYPAGLVSAWQYDPLLAPAEPTGAVE